jgi:hypothetical protein
MAMGGLTVTVAGTGELQAEMSTSNGTSRDSATVAVRMAPSDVNRGKLSQPNRREQEIDLRSDLLGFPAAPGSE